MRGQRLKSSGFGVHERVVHVTFNKPARHSGEGGRRQLDVWADLEGGGQVGGGYLGVCSM